MSAMPVYPIRLPRNIRPGLDTAAERHGMNTPEFVRAVLGLAAQQRIDLKGEVTNVKPAPAAKAA